MLADIRITATDVARAERRVHDTKREWDRYLCRKVAKQEIAEAETRLDQGLRELGQFYSLRWKARQVKLWVCRLLERAGVASSGWFAGSVLVGAVAVAVAVLPLMVLFGDLVPVFVGLAVVFLLAGAITAATVFRFSSADLVPEIAALRARLTDRRNNLAEIQKRLRGWDEHLVTLRRVRRAQLAYEDAAEHHRQLVDLLKSRRYQLAHADWRSLRGVPFEDFVKEIFEELGYAVSKTKVTGDQGVDLIAEGKGRRIAIQTKGYKGSVGNGSVQEAHTGMTFYSCSESAVVTNSRFTSGAFKLALSVRCTLIGEPDIPRLIEGDIY